MFSSMHKPEVKSVSSSRRADPAGADTNCIMGCEWKEALEVVLTQTPCNQNSWKPWHEGELTYTVQPLPQGSGKPWDSCWIWWGRRSWAIMNTLESVACAVSWRIPASESSSLPAALRAGGTTVQESGWGCARACNSFHYTQKCYSKT